ncbi:MAG: peptidoglycan DD-metalloendopeptidase family protein [Elusimicrobiota bacterium]|jgi:murein DD-endopeptidase MepM/ murein hydrolase activator NlpD
MQGRQEIQKARDFLKKESLFLWDKLNRVHPWIGRLVLYGLIGLCLFAGRRQYAHLLETSSIEHDANGVQVYTGDLGGRNLERKLLETGSSKQDVRDILRLLAKSGGVRRSYPGDSYELVRSTDDSFLHLTMIRGLKRMVVIPRRNADGFLMQTSNIPIIVYRHQARGDIRSNLWLSMQSRGVPPTIIQEFADIFQWSVDFLTETQAGDTFAVAWAERKSPDGRNWGRTIESGLYAGRTTGRHTGILFNDGYYDETGNSLQRMFLKAPLNYRRISSYFASSRYHPILKTRRPHNGTDYSAPYGTPVSSIGNGVISQAGYRGGLGNAVEVRHNSSYVTLYGHLKGFARGIHAGTHVRQGQVIGYVGSTGMSTGPHLHFQIGQSGRWIDFLRIKTPRDRTVPAAQMGSFASVRAQALQTLGESPVQVASSAAPAKNAAR